MTGFPVSAMIIIGILNSSHFSMEGMRSGYLGANPARTKRPIHVSPLPPPPAGGTNKESVHLLECWQHSVIVLLCSGGSNESHPLIFRPNWGPKGRKNFYLRPGPLLISGSGWPDPSSPRFYLKVWMLRDVKMFRYNIGIRDKHLVVAINVSNTGANYK